MSRTPWSAQRSRNGMQSMSSEERSALYVCEEKRASLGRGQSQRRGGLRARVCIEGAALFHPRLPLGERLHRRELHWFRCAVGLKGLHAAHRLHHRCGAVREPDSCARKSVGLRQGVKHERAVPNGGVPPDCARRRVGKVEVFVGFVAEDPKVVPLRDAKHRIDDRLRDDASRGVVRCVDVERDRAIGHLALEHRLGVKTFLIEPRVEGDLHRDRALRLDHASAQGPKRGGQKNLVARFQQHLRNDVETSRRARHHLDRVAIEAFVVSRAHVVQKRVDEFGFAVGRGVVMQPRVVLGSLAFRLCRRNRLAIRIADVQRVDRCVLRMSSCPERAVHTFGNRLRKGAHLGKARHSNGTQGQRMAMSVTVLIPTSTCNGRPSRMKSVYL